MCKKIQQTMKYCLTVLGIFVVAVAAASAQGEPPQRSLAGVWEVTTTPRNCTTGEPNLAAIFQGTYTFDKDGMVISFYSSGTPSTGQGLWQSELGWRDYSFKLVRLLRTSAGVLSGKHVIGGTLTLNESGDQYTSEEHAVVYGLDGVPGTPSCINSVGTRFALGL